MATVRRIIVLLALTEVYCPPFVDLPVRWQTAAGGE